MILSNFIDVKYFGVKSAIGLKEEGDECKISEV